MLFAVTFRERGLRRGGKHKVVQIAELHAAGYREAQAEARRRYPEHDACSVTVKEIAKSWFTPAPLPPSST